jgi:glycosyltransferase involved in cell wall biosynthesis
LKIWVATELDLAELGGPQEHLIGRWNHFSARNHDVTLFAPAPLGQTVRPLQFNFAPIQISWRPRQLCFQWELWKEWHRRWQSIDPKDRPQLIYVRCGQWLFAPTKFANQKQLPIVCESNGDIQLNLSARNFPKPLLRIANAIEHYVCTSAQRILTVGDGLKDVLVRRHGLAESRMAISPSGVDCTEFRPAENLDEKLALRRRLGVSKNNDAEKNPDDEIIIGYAGLFNWWHFLPSFIHALAALKNEHPTLRWRAVLAGYGDQEELLKTLVKNKGLDEQVLFTGRIAAHEMPAILRTFDIGLSLMPYNVFSIKFLQYAATGLPTIYPSQPNFAPLGEAEPGLRYAEHSPPESDLGLKGALLKLSTDATLRNELGKRSRELALRRLDWQHVVIQMEQIFTKVLKQ